MAEANHTDSWWQQKLCQDIQMPPKKGRKMDLKWQKASGGTLDLRYCPPVIHAKQVSDYTTDNLLVNLVYNKVLRAKIQICHDVLKKMSEIKGPVGFRTVWHKPEL